MKDAQALRDMIQVEALHYVESGPVDVPQVNALAVVDDDASEEPDIWNTGMVQGGCLKTPKPSIAASSEQGG
jgi:hypothetical protein